MKRTPAGLYLRHSTYLEIAVERNESYQSLAKKAANATKLAGDGGGRLALFKMNGAIISSDNIPVAGGFKRPWSLGSYLQLLMKKSPSHVKLGVGRVTEKEPPSDSSDSNEVSVKCACMLIHAYTLI